MIHLDAHVDAYGPVAGIKEHCGSIFKIALEEGLIDPHRTIQIGIRGAMGDRRQDDWAHDEGYRIIEIEEFNDIRVDSVITEARRIVGDDDDKPTYISWELDVLDPVYAEIRQVRLKKPRPQPTSRIINRQIYSSYNSQYYSSSGTSHI